MARIVEPTDAQVARAAARLRAGDVIAFPTETVYGLGADILNACAIRRVYALKGRPSDNPLIAHVSDASTAPDIVDGWDDRCSALAQRFWPGPLTFILRRKLDVPASAAAGLNTLAVRAPRHPVASRLLKIFGGAIVAPSANRSGHTSPTRATHVADDFAEAEDLLILDGGSSEVGIESTVLDMTSDPPRILRPGTIGTDALTIVLGEVTEHGATSQDIAPGTSAAHYAPRTPATLVSRSDLRSALGALSDVAAVLCFDAATVPPPHHALVMPADAVSYAAQLYSRLREADLLGVHQLLIEAPPADSSLWLAIHDRLRRATSEND